MDAWRAQSYRYVGSETGRAGGNPRRVLVLAIPDWGVTPFARSRDRAQVAAEIDAFNAACREEAARAQEVLSVRGGAKRAPLQVRPCSIERRRVLPVTGRQRGAFLFHEPRLRALRGRTFDRRLFQSCHV